MGSTPGGCRDLRKLQEDTGTFDAFSKLISGKSNYKTIIEKIPSLSFPTGSPAYAGPLGNQGNK